ncbi:MAG: ParA family protein [Leptolyngbya sp.]|nr:ParA family protein [Leptolyngbya sp.]
MIITVASFKGGVGKTTTAIHLAAFFHGDAETLLIDADPNRSALAWAHRGALPFAVTDEWQAGDHLPEQGHVVIDTQARPDPDDLAMLAKACDWLVLPTTPDVLALDALALMGVYLGESAIENYRVLLTMMPPSRRMAPSLQPLITPLQPRLFHHSVRRYAVYPKAAQQGQVVSAVKAAKAAEAWQDYGRIGEELLSLTVSRPHPSYPPS